MTECKQILDASHEFTKIQLAELERLRAIEFAAKEVFRVRGRFNTQTATCRLGELLGEKVMWPEKNLLCVEVATGHTHNAK